jgi:hypothetical protein
MVLVMAHRRLKPIIMKARCDICGVDAFCVYILEMDRWMCGVCVKTVVELLEICD